MLLQSEEKWATVRVPVELLEKIEELLKERDEFGLPKFRSKSEIVAEALKEFLKKHQHGGC